MPDYTQLFSKYKNPTFLHKLLTFPYACQSEIESAYKPFVSPSDLSFLKSTIPLTKQTKIPLKTPFSLTKKPELLKKLEIPTKKIIYEEEEVESDIELEHNQDIVCEGIEMNDQLENADFVLVKNKVYGLVGPNGIGKTTLLKNIRKRKFGIPAIKIVMVNQEHFVSEKTIIDYLMGSKFVLPNKNNLSENSKEYNEEEEYVDKDVDKEDVDKDIKEYKNNSTRKDKSTINNKPLNNKTFHDKSINFDDLSNLISNTDIARKKKEALKVLKEFGFKNPNETIKNLSGGWSCRVRLAKAILEKPDLLLLDEPTNMLDLESIFFLQSKIKNLSTVLVVSHDRNFLNEVCDSIIEFENKKLVTYKGNYDNFVKNKKIMENIKLKEYENILAEKNKLKEFIDKFRANAKRASLVQSRIKVYEKLVLPEIVKKSEFSFFISARECGNVLLDVKNLGFKGILKNVDLKVYKNSRIVVVGPNGVGKTTLLRCLAGKLECSGDVINFAKIGYFAQQHVENLPYDETVVEFWVRSTGSDNVQNFKKALGRFGLRGVEEKLIGLLSGGQKSRLCFAMIDYLSPNLLLLDEPTNHLDIDCIEALTVAIQNFGGAVVCVSHDMRFVESCFDEVYVCDGGLARFKGGIEEYKKYVCGKMEKGYF